MEMIRLNHISINDIKSELDYLYDDNENNVDKANNKTEIIEAEEVDTSKIDWDW